MKQILIFVFLLQSSIYTIGQKSCVLSSMPVASKEELNNFWKTLSKSLQQKDTSQLITLCNFPFFVSREIFSNNPLDRVQMYTLDSINLMQYANSIFFEKYFEIAIMECKEPASCLIFHGSFKQKKICSYVFCYTFNNDKGYSEERCFSVNHMGNTYKLASLWPR